MKGCINCREIAHDLQEHRSLLNALGVRTVAVFKENIPEDVRGFHEYAQCDLFVDEELQFFRALTYVDFTPLFEIGDSTFELMVYLHIGAARLCATTR